MRLLSNNQLLRESITMFTQIASNVNAKLQPEFVNA